MLYNWACCALITLAFPGADTGEIVIDMIATAPDQISITGDTFSTNADVLGINRLFESPEITNPVFSLSEAIVSPMENSIAIDKPEIDSVLAEGESRRSGQPDVVDYRIDESPLVKDSTHFELSRARDPGVGFGNGIGSVDRGSRFVRDEPIPDPSSLVFVGTSNRWIFMASVVLFFALATFVSVLLITRAPVIQDGDLRLYTVDGPRPARLGCESEGKRHRSERPRKARRTSRETSGAVLANRDVTPKYQPETIEDAAYYLLSSLTQAEHHLLRDASDDMLCVGIKIGIRQSWQVCNPNSPVFFDAVDNYEAYDADAVCDRIIETAQELLRAEWGISVGGMA